MQVFSPAQKALFEKNLQALKNTCLRANLSQIKHSEFKVSKGINELDFNLINAGGGGVMYSNPLKEFQASLELYNHQYALYPVLYFYGFGNGLLLKTLASNPNCYHLVIFENNLQILWTMFHYVDFSQELESQKFILIDTKTITSEELRCLVGYEPFLSYARVYFLELACGYYEKFSEDILRINALMSEALSFIIHAHGNDPTDALQGIEQLIYNLAQMITRPSLSELLKKRHKLSRNAIIVSTGPSLIKQLPLLKKYAQKALIFCADSAYPILAKWDILPDFVCMVERSELTAEFFHHDFKEFDKDIVFLCASLVHPNALKYLEQNERNFILIPKDSGFSRYMQLNQFGLLSNVSNVACMAYIFADGLKCENIILIGQDLAYDENGSSHPKDYQNSQDFESDMQKIPALAYGGKSEVLTHKIWQMFRQNLEDNILRLQAKCYNATEGGARIEHCIEKPFSECCVEFLKEDLPKPFSKLKTLNLEKQNELLLKAWARVALSLRHCEDFNLALKQHKEKLDEALLKFCTQNNEGENLSLTKILREFEEDLNDKIKLYPHLLELIDPYYMQWKFNLSKILVLQPKTSEDVFNKTVLYAKENLRLMDFIFEALELLKQKISENMEPLEEVLKKRKLTKYLRSKNVKNYRHS